jgi:predicted kinase
LRIVIPDQSLVILCGAPGSGKSFFAQQHFGLTQVVSSDFCRHLLTDDERHNREHNEAVFDLFHSIIQYRLMFGKLTVADATHLKGAGDETGAMVRLRVATLARRERRPVTLIGFDTPEEVCRRRDAGRNRRVEGSIIGNYCRLFGEQKNSFHEEWFESIYLLTPEQAESASLTIRRAQAIAS